MNKYPLRVVVFSTTSHSATFQGHCGGCSASGGGGCVPPTPYQGGGGALLSMGLVLFYSCVGAQAPALCPRWLGGWAFCPLACGAWADCLLCLFVVLSGLGAPALHPPPPYPLGVACVPLSALPPAFSPLGGRAGVFFQKNAPPPFSPYGGRAGSPLSSLPRPQRCGGSTHPHPLQSFVIF